MPILFKENTLEPIWAKGLGVCYEGLQKLPRLKQAKGAHSS